MLELVSIFVNSTDCETLGYNIAVRCNKWSGGGAWLVPEVLGSNGLYFYWTQACNCHLNIFDFLITHATVLWMVSFCHFKFDHITTIEAAPKAWGKPCPQSVVYGLWFLVDLVLQLLLTSPVVAKMHPHGTNKAITQIKTSIILQLDSKFQH